jgi:hypothetical protein
MTVHAQRSKKVVFKQPATVASNATHGANIDRLGFDYAVVDYMQNPTAATNTSAKWTSLQLMHGTTTDPSNHTAVSGKAVGTTNATATTSQFVLPQHNDTDDASTVRFYVDCRPLERYLRIQGQHPNTANLAWGAAELWRGDGMPDSDTERGVAVSTFV